MTQFAQSIQDLVGRRITHVVVKESSHPPTSQVFLVSDDNRYLELYSDATIHWTTARHDGGVAAARRYLSPEHHVVLETE